MPTRHNDWRTNLGGAANLTTGTTTIGTTAGGESLVAARPTRRAVTITNNDAAISVYIGAGTIAAIKALAASATVAVSWYDSYD